MDKLIQTCQNILGVLCIRRLVNIEEICKISLNTYIDYALHVARSNCHGCCIYFYIGTV